MQPGRKNRENLTGNLFEKWRTIDVQFQLFYYKYLDCLKKPVPEYLQPVDTSQGEVVVSENLHQVLH